MQTSTPPPAEEPDRTLSDYEKEQLLLIEEWKHKDPGVIAKAGGKLLAPVNWLVSRIIPQAAMHAALDVSNAAGKWMADWGTLKKDAGVNDYAELLKAKLEKCDALADSVHNWAIGLAAAEGGINGFFGLPGMAVDIPLIISFAMRTIHKIGLCYGFTLETEEDKMFALAILSAAGSNSIEEKVAALAMLRSIRVMVARTTFKKMAEMAAANAFGREAAVVTVRNLAKQLNINLTKRKIFQAIPFLGAVVGGAVNARFINEVGWAARRAFQEKWLTHNEKIIDV